MLWMRRSTSAWPFVPVSAVASVRKVTSTCSSRWCSIDRRVWTIRKIDDHTYEGTADDVVGTATGITYGNALNWQYDFDLQVGDSTFRVHFDDWMFLQDEDVMINRADVTKFGFTVGEASIFFQRLDAAEAAGIPMEGILAAAE